MRIPAAPPDVESLAGVGIECQVFDETLGFGAPMDDDIFEVEGPEGVLEELGGYFFKSLENGHKEVR